MTIRFGSIVCGATLAGAGLAVAGCASSNPGLFGDGGVDASEETASSTGATLSTATTSATSTTTGLATETATLATTGSMTGAATATITASSTDGTTGPATGTMTESTTGTATATNTGGTTDSTTLTATSTSTASMTLLDAGGGRDGGHPDAGRDAGTASDASDPLNAPARCTSGMTWNGRTGDTMRPGEACPSCHSNFYLAGTVYPTGHEPNDCDGVDALTTTGLTVVITEANGTVDTLYPDAVGNFFTTATVATPFTAKVVLNGKERAMLVAQTNTSCNSCHTQNGANSAPGRITIPE